MPDSRKPIESLLLEILDQEVHAQGVARAEPEAVIKGSLCQKQRRGDPRRGRPGIFGKSPSTPLFLEIRGAPAAARRKRRGSFGLKGSNFFHPPSGN